MANDFSTDPRVVALWKFESGALTVDSSGGNILVPSASPPTEDAVNFKEGACAALFTRASAQYYTVADANLDSDFPWKGGTTNYNGAIAFWFKCNPSTYQRLINKYQGAYNSFRIDTNGGNIRFIGSENNDVRTIATGMSAGWYHLTIITDHSGGVMVAVLYNQNSGNTTVSYFSNCSSHGFPAITGDLYIGSDGTNHLDGNMDEIVVLKGTVTVEEAYSIRQGNFPTVANNNDFSSDSRCFGWWKFESGALTVDTKGLNDLTAVNTPTEDLLYHMQGGCSAVQNQTAVNYFYRNDADLAAGTPLKSGDTVKKLTMCGWLKLTNQTYYHNIGLCKGTTNPNSTNGGGLAFLVNNSNIWFCWGTGPSTGDTIYTSLYLWFNTWTHFSAVVDGVNKWVYIRLVRGSDGAVAEQFIKCVTEPGGLIPNGELYANPTKPWRFGYNETVGGITYSFTGNNDEWVLFNDLLTIRELDAIRLGYFNSTNFPRADIYRQGLEVAYGDQPKIGSSAIQLIYGGLPAYGVGMHGLQVVYQSDVIAAVNSQTIGILNPAATGEIITMRQFPTPAEKRVLQSQPYKRRFPIVK